ncbi:MAG TPA: hypothetical protein VMF68_02640 [Spirochaetia bacterium]|nr:hypothetical protein [Spirochaetia bacterium]
MEIAARVGAEQHDAERVESRDNPPYELLQPLPIKRRCLGHAASLHPGRAPVHTAGWKRASSGTAQESIL